MQLGTASLLLKSLLLTPVPALADSLSIGTDFYSGRVISVTADTVIFDFACSGQVAAVELEPELTIKIDKTCGEVEGFQFGGRNLCTEKAASSTPHVYAIWYLLEDGTEDYWIFDYFRYEA